MTKTTKEKLYRYWRKYNKKVFDNQLQPPVFILRKYFRFDKQAHGYHCRYPRTDYIGMLDQYESEQQLKQVLIHEMVHQWQALHNCKDEHGKTFKSWQEPIRQKTDTLLLVRI